MSASSYGGTWLTDKQGNNAFVYDERKQTENNPKLRIPSIQEISSVDEIELGHLPVFVEKNQTGQIQAYTGLQHIYHLNLAKKHGASPASSSSAIFGPHLLTSTLHLQTSCYIFDNHNHALFLWANHILDHLAPSQTISNHFQSESPHFPKLSVIHIDQHSDLNDPTISLYDYARQKGYVVDSLGKVAITPDCIASYTNQVCNVGNFIKPALETGLISECIRIKNQYDLDHFTFSCLNQPDTSTPSNQYSNISTSSSAISSPSSAISSPSSAIFGPHLLKSTHNLQTSPYILDIDLDFWAPGMGTDIHARKDILKNLMKHAQLITIATSPHFLNQKVALELLYQLLD